MARARFTELGLITQTALVASALVAFLSLIGLAVVPAMTEPLADMRIEPLRGSVIVGDTFDVSVTIAAKTPVNVFKGEIGFDHSKLMVDSISYNTSIANLWAKRPWYQNGDGTLGFIGGTTMKGGFLGDGTLITVTFRSLAEGDAYVRFYEARILEHDGLGTDVTLDRPIDAIFASQESVIDSVTVAKPKEEVATIDVVRERPSTDVNGDGKQTIADLSIFMRNITSDDARYDFNLDGAVDVRDLSILMGAR